MTKLPPPLEHEEETDLAEILDLAGLLHWHNPNEVPSRKLGRLLKMGFRPGVPDHFIADPPPRPKGCRGVFVELKRQSPAYRKPSREQRELHHTLADHGYTVIVAKGAADAVRQLRALGYDLPQSCALPANRLP